MGCLASHRMNERHYSIAQGSSTLRRRRRRSPHHRFTPKARRRNDPLRASSLGIVPAWTRARKNSLTYLFIVPQSVVSGTLLIEERFCRL
jgi:hypothetical protein